MDAAVSCRSEVCYPFVQARQVLGSEAPRVHHASRWRGGCVAARGTRAAARADAAYRRAGCCGTAMLISGRPSKDLYIPKVCLSKPREPMASIGYARVSSTDQDFEAQVSGSRRLDAIEFTPRRRRASPSVAPVWRLGRAQIVDSRPRVTRWPHDLDHRRTSPRD